MKLSCIQFYHRSTSRSKTHVCVELARILTENRVALSQIKKILQENEQ